VWRELRRIRNECPDELIEAHSAADTGNWRRYCEVMETLPLSLAKQGPLNPDTGEIKMNRYMEPAADTITGLRLLHQEFSTRNHTWEIKGNAGKNSGGFTGGVRVRAGFCLLGGSGGGIHKTCSVFSQAILNQQIIDDSALYSFDLRGAVAAPWSSVNNCTGVENVGGDRVEFGVDRRWNYGNLGAVSDRSGGD
jgi:hypothetical protein